MPTLTQKVMLAKLPQDELKESLSEFMRPLTELLPDVRLPAVAELTVQGILSSESPVITQIARGWRTRSKRCGRAANGCIAS